MYQSKRHLEDKLITRNSSTSSASTEDTFMEADIPAEQLEKKKAALLQQESNQEPEITREQLSIGKRLLNWRTLVPLVIVIAALLYFAKQAHINPQQTWAAIRAANPWFLTNMGRHPGGQSLVLTRFFQHLLPLIPYSNPALEFFTAKCRLYEIEWRTPAQIPEAAGNSLYLLVRQCHRSGQAGRSLSRLPAAHRNRPAGLQNFWHRTGGTLARPARTFNAVYPGSHYQPA